MGLDLTVFTKVILTDPHERVDACWDADHIRTFPSHFPQSHRGLVPDRCYVSVGESWGFYGGSYSGYGYFRSLLSQAAHNVDPTYIWENPDSYRDRIFYEWIYFSDCEGCIGPEACADLAADFDAYPLLGETFTQGGLGSWQERYAEWGKAFHDAAGSGLVQFH